MRKAMLSADIRYYQPGVGFGSIGGVLVMLGVWGLSMVLG